MAPGCVAPSAYITIYSSVTPCQEPRLLPRKMQSYLSQPFAVAEVFTGSPGKYVSLKETINGFQAILSGDMDEYPEQAFYMVGQIEEVAEKAKTLT